MLLVLAQYLIFLSNPALRIRQQYLISGALPHEDYYAVFDLLYRCNLIVPSFIREELTRQEALQFLYKLYEGELPLPYEGDYLWQFRHPVIRNFALARLDEKHECELMKQRCLNFYYSLFSIFIMAKYGWGRTPAELAKMEEFSRLSSEYAAFSQAMREMREARYQYIKERLIASYYQNLDLYEETLNALKLPPETLTQRQEDLIEDYATIYEEVTKDPKCPYPLAEWFWKYLDYELNPNYFATPNVFAVMNGRLAIYAMMDEDKVPARININNL